MRINKVISIKECSPGKVSLLEPFLYSSSSPKAYSFQHHTHTNIMEFPNADLSLRWQDQKVVKAGGLWTVEGYGSPCYCLK